MYHLVLNRYVTPVICYSCETFSSLRRYVNALKVPYLGLSFDVYDFNGHFYGVFVRLSPKEKAFFVKSPRYGTENYACIYYAQKSPKMGTRCRRLLNRYYSGSMFSDFVRFYPEDTYID